MVKLCSISLICWILPLLAQDGDAGRHSLNVLVEGFENDAGTVHIALCNSRENYEAHDHAFRSRIMPVRDGHAVAVFDSLPDGEYAVKVFHDENENEQLDTNFLGVPSEAYGFSNNARGVFGPAHWDDAKFFFPSSGDTIRIRVQ